MKEQQPQDCSQSRDRKRGFHLKWECQGGCLQVPCTRSSPGFYSFLQNLARERGTQGEEAPHLSAHFILFNPSGHWPGWRAIIACNSGPPGPSCPLYLQPLPNLKGSCQYQGPPLFCYPHLAFVPLDSSSPLWSTPILQAVGSISPKRN